MPPFGMLPAKGLSFSQQFLPALIMGGIQGAQQGRKDEYERKMLSDIMAGVPPTEAMAPAPQAGGIMGMLGNIVAPQPGISSMSPFTQKFLAMNMPSPKNTLQERMGEASIAERNARATAVTKRIIPGNENYWITDIVTGETKQTDIPVKNKGVYSDPVTAGADDLYAEEGTTYQFGPDNQMRVISKPASPLDTQRIAESKTREAATAKRAEASTKRVVPGDEYYFSVDTVTGETVQTKARVPVKDKGRYSDPVTAAEDDPYGVPAGTTYQFGPDNQMRTISKPTQQKTQDTGKLFLYWQAVENNALQETPPDTETAAYARKKIGALRTEQPAVAAPSKTRKTGETISTNDVRMQSAPDMRLDTYWPKLTEKQRQDIIGAMDKNPASLITILERLSNASPDGQGGPAPTPGSTGTTRYLEIRKDPDTGEQIGFNGKEWVPVTTPANLKSDLGTADTFNAPPVGTTGGGDKRFIPRDQYQQYADKYGLEVTEGRIIPGVKRSVPDIAGIPFYKLWNGVATEEDFALAAQLAQQDQQRQITDPLNRRMPWQPMR